MNEKIFSGHQPNFIPYLGVFYKIMKSDIFVLDDDVQYSKSGLHNANFMKICGQKSKITIPVNMKFGDLINEVRICNGPWIKKLERSVKMNYGKAEHFDEGYEFFERHLNAGYEFLSDMNIEMIKEISRRMGLKAKIVIASKDVPTHLKNNERNVYQCVKLGCNVYYSGIGGADYNDADMYSDNGIKIIYSDFKASKYKQIGNGFIPNLSVLDYIMNEGFNIPKNWENT